MNRTTILVFRFTFLAFLAAGTWLSLTPQPPQIGPSDKLEHATAYFLLAAVADFAFPVVSYVLKAVSLLGYGILMEILQRYVPGRAAELGDVAANATGILLFAVCVPLLKRIPVVRSRWR